MKSIIAMRNLVLLAILSASIIACQTQASNEEKKPELKVQNASYMNAAEPFRDWVDARAGTGEPVHWVSEGGVYEYPSGKKLFGMMGFDSSISIWPDEEGGEVIHLTRKTFAYTDPETGEVLKEYQGNPVKPIAYPYQMITYRFENDRIYGDLSKEWAKGFSRSRRRTAFRIVEWAKATSIQLPFFWISLYQQEERMKPGKTMISSFIPKAV